MKSVFLLWHTHQLPEGGEDEKLLGVYSSRELAEKKIADKYRTLPGFQDVDGEYGIDTYVVDQDWWEEGFTTIHRKTQK